MSLIIYVMVSILVFDSSIFMTYLIAEAAEEILNKQSFLARFAVLPTTNIIASRNFIIREIIISWIDRI